MNSWTFTGCSPKERKWKIFFTSNFQWSGYVQLFDTVLLKFCVLIWFCHTCVLCFFISSWILFEFCYCLLLWHRYNEEGNFMDAGELQKFLKEEEGVRNWNLFVFLDCLWCIQLILKKNSIIWCIQEESWLLLNFVGGLVSGRLFETHRGKWTLSRC